MTPPYLSAEHRKMLSVDSGISDAMIDAVGFFTATKKCELARLGFSPRQQSVPALVVPGHGITDDFSTTQIRPDSPRLAENGKAIKYETPSKGKMSLFVPPGLRDKVRGIVGPLWITEGGKKACAAACRGLTCIALMGVENWRGTNDVNGKTALPDWAHIHVRDRTVYVVYDSDVMVKKQVKAALRRFGAMLQGLGADVRYVFLPPREDGEKVGLDDFFAQGGTTQQLISFASETIPGEAEEADEDAFPEFRMANGATFKREFVNGERSYQKLANFEARIIRDYEEDNGEPGPRERKFVIHGISASGAPMPAVEVAASAFDSLGWIRTHWGSKAIYDTGRNKKEALAAAILNLSEPVSETVRTHTGWCSIDGVMAYLHGDGAIGASGPIADVRVKIDPRLSKYRLPTPVDGPDEIEAVLASLTFLDIGPDWVTFPIYAGVFRSVMGPANFVQWVEGKTQIFKSSLVDAAMSHFGTEFLNEDRRFKWDATRTALEAATHRLKDAAIMLDDYKPGNPRVDDVTKGLIQSIGDGSSRDRSNTTLGFRSQCYPRGFVFATAEQSPPGDASGQARCMIVHVKRGDIDSRRLRAYQDMARLGPPSQAMAGFVRYLAGHYSETVQQLNNRAQTLRDDLARSRNSSASNRSLKQMADLLLGLEGFLVYAVSISAISTSEREAYWKRGVNALWKVVEDQASMVHEIDPLTQLCSLTNQLLNSGKAHVLNAKTGGNAGLGFGWRDDPLYPGGNFPKPCGIQIGWVDHEKRMLYLMGSPWWSTTCDLARGANESFHAKKSDLLRQAKEAGYLGPCEVNRYDSKCSVFDVEGQRRTERCVSLRLDKVKESCKEEDCDPFADDFPSSESPEMSTAYDVGKLSLGISPGAGGGDMEPIMGQKTKPFPESPKSPGFERNIATSRAVVAVADQEAAELII